MLQLVSHHAESGASGDRMDQRTTKAVDAYFSQTLPLHASMRKASVSTFSYLAIIVVPQTKHRQIGRPSC